MHMRPTAGAQANEPSEYLQYVENQVVRIYAAIVILLLLLGGLVWGTVSAVQAAPRALDDSGFLLLALGGLGLAITVLILLAQLSQWARRRY
jgi:hypothetical protein